MDKRGDYSGSIDAYKNVIAINNTNEAALLESCYRNCLEIAKAKKCKSMAFPIISSGTFKFPKEEAFRIAVQTINQFMDSYEMDVYLVVFNKEITYISKQLFKDVKEYIDDHYEAEEAYYSRRNHIPFEKCISFESSIHKTFFSFMSSS